MVKVFKRTHTNNMVGSEMYDDGFPNNSDEEEDKFYDQDPDKHFAQDHDSPNLESPRPSKDFREERVFRVNRKVDCEEDVEPACEDSPDIPNEISPGMSRKASSNTSQRDYEVIGDHLVRDTITPKNKPKESFKGNDNMLQRKYTQEQPKYAKTDKGFSEISQLKKKNLSVIV